MTELIEQVENLAREFAARGATAGTLEMHHNAVSGYGARAHGSIGTLMLPRKWPDTAAISAAVRAELGVDKDADDLVQMRLRVRGDSYEFQYRCQSQHYENELGWDFTRQVIRDPTYRYPGHAVPSPVADENPDGRPTDPELVATVADLVREYVELRSRQDGHAPQLGAGITEAEIAAAESRIGFRLPEELRALYRVVGYDDDDRGLLAFTALQPLAIIAATHLNDDIEVADHYGAGTVGAWRDSLFADFGRTVLESWPHGVVRRISRSPKWVIIGSSDRDVTAVDLDPGPIGVSGQVIEFEPDGLGAAVRRDDSVLAMLRRTVESLRVGESAFEYYNAEIADHPNMHAYLRGAGESVAELAGAIAVQSLTVDGRDSFDAAELAALPLLRQLEVRVAESVRLSVPHTVPLEQLRLTAPRIDLHPLAGHPALWDLSLSGTTEPVRISPLATLPALQRLDISEIEVSDLETVATLPALRVLVATMRQWRLLRDRDAVPAGLAAAQLVGDAAFGDEIAWAADLGVDPGTASLPIMRGTL
ncbi:SMI1/KNR4 family protein [Nocardia sp. NBC_01503]|uniref:SMI1/KNR4 family protein n=1 Tax=Nocardia sp. NBC_01503 TaxID=2975997 RepID=UPI002E7C094A|nr:SMI1/KNR4 family protein [Nocardia sp. NBC_01503]WTL31136.1 SMI1/KNR4 family protein [Nocardia sp. NBC_01503]